MKRGMKNKIRLTLYSRDCAFVPPWERSWFSFVAACHSLNAEWNKAGRNIIYSLWCSIDPPGRGGGGRLGRGLQVFRLQLHLPSGSRITGTGSLRVSGSSPWAHHGTGLGGHKETHPTVPLRPLQVQYPVHCSLTKRCHGL